MSCDAEDFERYYGPGEKPAGSRADRRRAHRAARAGSPDYPRVLILPGGTLHVDPGAPSAAVEAAKRAIAKHRREGGTRRSFYLKPGPEGW